MMCAIEAVLLGDDSVSVPLRLDGAITVNYLTRFVCDLVRLLSSTASPVTVK